MGTRSAVFCPLPEAGLLLFNNLLPQRWEDAKAEHARERRRLNQELWSNILVMFGLAVMLLVRVLFMLFTRALTCRTLFFFFGRIAMRRIRSTRSARHDYKIQINK